MAISEVFYASRSLASAAAAQHVSENIRAGLGNAKELAIVLTGGSTPKECYETLAKIDLPWNNVHILLSDDRCVPIDHEASNEGMVRRLFATDCARDVRIVSIYDPEVPPEDTCIALSAQMESLPMPFSISLLGMGADGHFASLFPDVSGLEDGLDEDGEERCLPVHTAFSRYPRITLTMATLIKSKEMLLFFFGEDKRDVYESAKLPESAYPISRLLQQEQTPVRVIWAP